MADAKDLHRVVDNFVHDDVRPRRKHQFPSAWGQANSPTIRKYSKRGHRFMNRLSDSLSGGRVVSANAFDNAREVVCG